MNYTVLDEHLHEHGVDLLIKSDHAQVVCELTMKKESKWISKPHSSKSKIIEEDCEKNFVHIN